MNIKDMLFPSGIYCICCGSVTDDTRPYALCDSCVRKFHWTGKRTCARCGKILDDDYRKALCYDCTETDHAFRKGYTCTRYGLYERVLISNYKYSGQLHIARKLGEIMADRMGYEDTHHDIVIPVPVYAGKKIKKGYDHAALMAGYFSRCAGIRFGKDILYRKRSTAPMKDLDAPERTENVRDAFGIGSIGEDTVKGKEILLVEMERSTLIQCNKRCA